MKKFIGLILFSALLFAFVGCQNKMDVAGSIAIQSESSSASSINSINAEKKDPVTATIIANYDADAKDGLPIIFNSRIEGDADSALQYHWILETDNDNHIEGFVIPDQGPQKEITNSGEPVKLGLFAIVDYVIGGYVEIKVKLFVENKETSEMIAMDEITIENRSGSYQIRR